MEILLQGRKVLEANRNPSNLVKLQRPTWRKRKLAFKRPGGLPSCKLSLLSILLRLYLTAVLKLTSFMSWRSRRNGIGEGRQSVSSAHCEPLSYISSICLFVSFSKGCHTSFVASPHSQIALMGKNTFGYLHWGQDGWLNHKSLMHLQVGPSSLHGELQEWQ